MPLHPTWSRWARSVLDDLGGSAPRSHLAAVLDVDATTGTLDPDGLLAVGTVAAVEAGLVSTLLAHTSGSADAVRTRVRSAVEAATGAISGHAPSPAPGVVQLLEHCWSEGIPVAIVTNDRREGTLAQLAAMGLLGLVDPVVCGDDGLEPKPSGAMLAAACTAMDVAPADALMVGDTRVDRLAAEDAGVPFVLLRDVRPVWAQDGTLTVRDAAELLLRLR